MPSHIQSVLFDIHKWTPSHAKEWLRNNNLHPIKPVHKTLNFMRYRIEKPEHFHRFRIKKVKGGIEFVIGFY